MYNPFFMSEHEKFAWFIPPSHPAICAQVRSFFTKSTVVIGENKTFKGPEDYSQSRGVKLIHLDSEECKQLMDDFIRERPELWNEDIGI